MRPAVAALAFLLLGLAAGLRTATWAQGPVLTCPAGCEVLVTPAPAQRLRAACWCDGGAR